MEKTFGKDRKKDGQSLASQGSAGTGYILLNAQPTDDYTPYIDIVERQSTAVGTVSQSTKENIFGEVTTLARIGDLSGITDYNFSDAVEGYGIYTSNGYFSGVIEVASLPTPPPSEKLLSYWPLDSLGFSDATGNTPGTGSVTTGNASASTSNFTSSKFICSSVSAGGKLNSCSSFSVIFPLRF